MSTPSSRRPSPRLNRVALWVTALIAVELAIAGAVLMYRSIVNEVPAGSALFWSGIFALSVMGIHAAFWTVVWALKSQPLRPIWAWSAFTVLMAACGLSAIFAAQAVISMLQPIG